MKLHSAGQALLPLLLLSPFSSISAEEYKQNVAVLDLGGSLSQDELVTLTNKLIVELMKSGMYTVVERTEMENILNEMGFQQAGCTSSECAVEVGQMLGVDKMIAGNIGRVGSLFSIALRTIDVRTSKILKHITVDFKGSIEDVLVTGIGQAVGVLTGKTPKPSAPVAVAAGDLHVTSEPVTGEIYLDDVLQAGKKTPATIQNIPVGKHQIKVVRKGLVGSGVVEIGKDDLVKVHLKLRQGRGKLKVLCSPGGAEVFVDRESNGKAPVVLDDLSAGKHSVRVTKPGYFPYVGEVEVEIGKVTRVNCTLQEAAYMTITTVPDEAQVVMNGVVMGKTPLTEAPMRPGRVDVVLRKAHYDSVSFTHTAVAGKKYKVSKTLQRQLASILLKAYRVDSAKVNDVFVGPRRKHIVRSAEELQVDVVMTGTAGSKFKVKGTTPIECDTVPAGSYKISFRGDKYDDVHKVVPIKKGDNLSLVASMRYNKKYMLDSLVKEDYTSRRRAKNALGTLCLIGSIGSGAASAVFGVLKTAQYDGYMEATSQHEMDALYADYETSQTQTTIFGIAGGVAFAGALFLYIKPVKKKPASNFDVGLGVTSDGGKFEITYDF